VTGQPGLGGLVERARATLDLAPDTPARAWRVFPLSEATREYALVEFGERSAVVAVVAVDAQTGELLSSARLPGTGPHLAVGEASATGAAGRSGTRVRLVWRPSRQSASPLYPLWEVSGSDPAEPPVYVDHAGRVWPAIEPGGPGG